MKLDTPRRNLADIVAASLTHGFDELVDAMCDGVRRECLAYGNLSDQDGFRETMARTARSFTGTLLENRPLLAGEAATFVVAGATRCRQGIPEDAMVRAVRVGAKAGIEFLVRAIGDSEHDPTAVAQASAHVSTRTFDFLEQVENGLRSGWRTEHEHRLPAHVRGQATIIDMLLDVDASNAGEFESELFDQARDLGVDLRPGACGLLVVTPGDWPNAGTLREVASQLAEKIPCIEGPSRSIGPPHAILGVSGATDVVWASAAKVADVLARANNVLIVLVPPAPTLSRVGPAYRQLAPLLEYARAERRWPGTLPAERLRSYVAWSRLSMGERVDMCFETLGRVLELPPPKREELLTAFEAWSEAGGQRQLAASMLGPGVKPHTVSHRIDRFERLTERSVSVGGDRLLLDSVVRMYRAWVASALAERDY